MQLIKRHKREAALVGVMVVTMVVLLIIIAFPAAPTTPKASLGELFGNTNRVAPAGGSVANLTDQQIASYQEKVRANPNTTVDQARLGLAYLQKAREVGDPTYYNKAEAVFKKTLELDPKNVEALGGMGSLYLSRHQFARGLEYGQQALVLKQSSYNYGVITDGLVELGRYDEATETVQKMVNLRPDISSYSRVSYIRELYGEYDGAIEAMKEAVDAGAPKTENRAYVTYQLGNLYFNRGEVDQAEKVYTEALAMFPDYFYAQTGLAKVEASRGNFDKAIEIYLKVTQRLPLSEFIIELGDLYSLTNRLELAQKQYDLVRAIQKIYRENGVNTDMEMALFEADHNNDLPQALERARQEYAARPSIKAADVLAWTLYKSGDYQGASDASKQALKLGTLDRLAFFHAGMIAAKLGQKDEARQFLQKALVNPSFSFLHAAEARKTLLSLES